MRHPVLLGFLTAGGVFLGTALLILALSINPYVALLLGIFGFFVGIFAGSLVTDNLRQRASGFYPASDEPRSLKGMPMAPLDMPNHIGDNAQLFN